jgi:lysyl-tRNA synthetase class 2
MLEFYQAYADYEDVMRLVESMLSGVVQELGLDPRCPYGEHTVDLTPPFRRLAYFDALAAAAGRDVRDLGVAELRELLVARGLEPPASERPESFWDELFDELVQPGLVEPTFVVDYPREVSPLARVKRGDERLVERFELFAGGLELGNAFSEQIDPEEQERQLERQDSLRQAGDFEAQAIDEDYIRALMVGMPPTGGFGLGIDRLAMLLANRSSIRDVILFPLLRPLAGGGSVDGDGEPRQGDEAGDPDGGTGVTGESPAERAP